MNRKETIRQTELLRKLEELGFTESEFDTLRRISMTLHRWAERECNGEVEVDDDGKSYQVIQGYPGNAWKVCRYSCRNMEAGAIKRLEKILQSHPAFTYYHQTDPRGASLYLINKAQSLYSLQTVDSNYNQIGICVY